MPSLRKTYRRKKYAPSRAGRKSQYTRSDRSGIPTPSPKYTRDTKISGIYKRKSKKNRRNVKKIGKIKVGEEVGLIKRAHCALYRSRVRRRFFAAGGNSLVRKNNVPRGTQFGLRQPDYCRRK